MTGGSKETKKLLTYLDKLNQAAKAHSDGRYWLRGDTAWILPSRFKGGTTLQMHKPEIEPSNTLLVESQPLFEFMKTAKRSPESMILDIGGLTISSGGVEFFIRSDGGDAAKSFFGGVQRIVDRGALAVVDGLSPEDFYERMDAEEVAEFVMSKTTLAVMGEVSDGIHRWRMAASMVAKPGKETEYGVSLYSASENKVLVEIRNRNKVFTSRQYFMTVRY